MIGLLQFALIIFAMWASVFGEPGFAVVLMLMVMSIQLSRIPRKVRDLFFAVPPLRYWVSEEPPTGNIQEGDIWISTDGYRRIFTHGSWSIE